MIESLNEFVIKFSNVNGSGSASANGMFAKAVFRMGIPVAPRNIFPSNIQGLPTWFEVRVSEKGHMGRRGGVDFMVAMNPQTLDDDVAELEAGGCLLYDSTRARDFDRDDISVVGIPITALCLSEFGNSKQRQLFKNMVYLGALSPLVGIEFDVLVSLVAEQFPGKEHLMAPNIKALEIGRDYALEHFGCPLGLRLKRCDKNDGQILIDGNTAAGLGCVYGGATVAAWYPITPSTSLADAFGQYCAELRVDPDTGRNNYAIVQAEDELSAIGITVGASWNGARAFTATSGPGISLMTEFIGLAYFAEIPIVVFDVERGGPSTGMPTRTQQSDLLSCAYASHGDTKHVLIFPSDPNECFELSATAFDLADRLQTPIMVMSDLDIGMNDWSVKSFAWDDTRKFDRGKVLDERALESLDTFGRYLDVDGDGIPYRTYPGTHPEKGAFFTRGTSRDRFAIYTEKGDVYQDNMERLLRKFATAAQLVPKPEIQLNDGGRFGVIYFGSTDAPMKEALEELGRYNVTLDAMRIRGFPFNDQVAAFVNAHERLFVVEQNRDGQMRTLLMNECGFDPNKLVSVCHYDGMPITAKFIGDELMKRVGPHQAIPVSSPAE